MDEHVCTFLSCDIDDFAFLMLEHLDRLTTTLSPVGRILRLGASTTSSPAGSVEQVSLTHIEGIDGSCMGLLGQ